MERDSRRDRGQWRGCYTFKDIVCEGDAGSVPKRNGGLKMGHTYYYYYELDGASETHDPSQPSTNTCPYLPGQTVNTLWIPVEQSGRKRSASLTSLREEDFKTMDPASKFVTPRPAPCPPEPVRQIGTAPLRMQHQKQHSRSPSPGPRWMFSPRKLFSRKSSSSSLKDAYLRDVQTPPAGDERNLRSDGSRSRDISPESLRRFLVDDTPLDQEHEDNSRPAIEIPEDIIEENEDDDNFATSAVSETMQFTGLSPPPQRAHSPERTTTPPLPPWSPYLAIPAAPTSPPPPPPATRDAPLSNNTSGPQSDSDHSPLSALYGPEPEQEQEQPPSPQSPDSRYFIPAFYDSEDEDNDSDPLPGMDTDTAASQANHPFARNLAVTLSTYSLPRTAGTEDKMGMGGQRQPPATAATAAGAAFLTSPIPDSALGDLVSELGWMAELI